jgi:hypothetical protein
VLLLFLARAQVYSQPDSTLNDRAAFTVTGLVDVFYSYDFNQPATNYRQPFFYNHNRHNEFNLNLGLVRLAVDHTRYRGNIALHTGTYPADNYANEPDLLKNIFEANAGVSLSDEHNLWLDAGIFPSPIGFESPIPFDNTTLTRSILADNSPYYLTGARVMYTPNDAWMLMGMLTNGWQRIKRLEGNSLPSFSTQIQYTPNGNTTFNWSTFIGTDDPDSTRRMRYFNNVYSLFQLTAKTDIIIGMDVGMQQINKGSSKYQWWYAPIVIVRQALTDKWSAAFRAEYYQDKDGIIIPAETPNGFRTTGLSMNMDYQPEGNILCRLEGRWLTSQDNMFTKNDQAVSSNFFITASIAAKLDYPHKK